MCGMKKKKSHAAPRSETQRCAVPRVRPGLARPQMLVRAILVIACLMLFVPLVVNDHFYYAHVFLKSVLFRAGAEAILLLYVILALTSPNYRPRFNRISCALLAWFGVMVFCSLPGISSNAWKSWWGDFPRMDGMVTQLHLLAFFFVLVQSLKREREWLALFAASLAASTFMGATGILQMASEAAPRISGSTGNPNFFGTYMLLNLGIGSYFLLRKDREDLYPWLAKTWLFLLGALDAAFIVYGFASGGEILSAALGSAAMGIFAVVLHAGSLLWFWTRQSRWTGMVFLGAVSLYDLFWLYKSQTRAVVVGLAAGLAFMAILYAWKGTSRRLKWAAALLILLFAALPVTLFRSRDSGWVQNSVLLRRLTSTTFAERRFVVWKVGTAGIFDRPVWGWGVEHYRKAFDLHVPIRLFQGEAAEHWDDRAHNILLDVGTTTGALGLAAFLFFYALLFRFLVGAWLKDRNATGYLSLSALLAAYLVQNLFSFDTVHTMGIVFLLLAHAAYLAGSNNAADPDDTAPVHAVRDFSGIQCAAAAAAIALVAAAFWYSVAEPSASNRSLRRAIDLSRTATPQVRMEIVDTFLRAEARHTTGVHQVREQFANYAIALAAHAEIPLREKAETAQKAVAALQRSIDEDPVDSRHYMYASTLTNGVVEVMKLFNTKDALSLAERNLKLLEKAEIFGPNRPRIALERAQSLLALGRTGEAIAELRKAVLMDPHNRSIRMDLTAALISAGRYGEAEEERRGMIASGLPPLDSDYDRLARLYADREQIDVLVILYEEQLKQRPGDAAILARLATAYREAGKKDLARKTAIRAARLSKSAAADLEAFLKTLE